MDTFAPIRRRFRQLQAFTLSELLTVIVIIAIIAALIFPVYSNAQSKGHAATCLGNLRQIGAGMSAYCGENDGEYPQQSWWSDGASPAAISRGSSVPNGLGHLAFGGYLGEGQGAPTLKGTGRPGVLLCKSVPGIKLFRQSNVWASYVYQSPFPLASGASDQARPNKMSLVRSEWAMVVDAGQVFSNNVASHPSSTTSVLYADGHTEARPWIGSMGKSTEAWPRRFDLTKEARQ